MYLAVPAKLKYFFGVGKNIKAINDDSFRGWRLDLIHHGENRYILVVHIMSLFCKIIPSGNRAETIISIGNALGCAPFDIKFGSNNNRSVIGSVKDMHNLIDSWGSNDKILNVNQIEAMINKTPFSYLGMETPAMRWIHLTSRCTGADHNA